MTLKAQSDYSQGEIGSSLRDCAAGKCESEACVPELAFDEWHVRPRGYEHCGRGGGIEDTAPPTHKEQELIRRCRSILWGVCNVTKNDRHCQRDTGDFCEAGRSQQRITRN